MSIVFNCSRCGKMLSVPDQQAGLPGKCTACKAPVIVPRVGSSWDLSPTPAVGSVSPVATMPVEVPKRRFNAMPWAVGAGSLMLLGLAAAFLYQSSKPTWEQANWKRVEALKVEAEKATRAGKIQEADAGYDQIAQIVGSRQLNDPILVRIHSDIQAAAAKVKARRLELDAKSARELESQRAADALREKQLAAAREKAAAATRAVASTSRPTSAPAAIAVVSPTTPATLPASAPTAVPRKEMTPEQIVASSEKSVALIRTKDGSGTGFLVAPGLLVTNHHVIRHALAGQITAFYPGLGKAGKKATPAQRLVYVDRARDLAFIRVTSDLPALPLGAAYAFRRGQTVTVIGNPGLSNDVVLENAVSVGVMSTQAQLNGLPFYQLSVGVNPGNSGGPCFDSTGSVIGVLTLKASRQENIAFCVPLEDVRAALVKAQATTPADATKLISFHNAEAIVRRVAAGGDVYLSGLDGYVDFMERALGEEKTANEGLVIASKTLKPKIDQADKLIIDDVRATIASVNADTRLPQATRDQMIELWAVYREGKGMFDTPKGTLATYKAKAQELRTRHGKAVEALKALLGLESLAD